MRLTRYWSALPAIVGLMVGALFPEAAAGAPLTTGFTAIAVRDSSGNDTGREPGYVDPPSLAIDGDTSTSTYLTASDTTSPDPQEVFLDLGSATAIQGFRWFKTDEYVDPHDLYFSYSTDTGPLTDRTFTPVTNIQNGYQGTETVNGTFSANSITNESDGFGVYSATFDPVLGATAIRFDFYDASFEHYHVNELEAIVPEPTSMGALLGVASVVLLHGRRRAANDRPRHE